MKKPSAGAEAMGESPERSPDPSGALATMFTLKQLEAFYWSGLLGSFSAAAKKLHTTQSAIAKRVAELESFVGASLLDRKPRALLLTGRGRLLYPLAEEMLEVNTRIVRKMISPDALEGVVRLGATELIGMTWLAKLIDETRRRYPRIQLLPDIDGGVTLYERLGEGSVDLAIMPGPFWSHEYDSVPLASIKNAWMASPKLNIDPDSVLSARDLMNFPIISQPTNSALSYLYAAWFAQQGIDVKRVMTCNSVSVIVQMTMLGLGISYLPAFFFRPWVEQGKLVELKVRPLLPHVNYHIVYKKSVLNHIIAPIIELAQEVCDFHLQGAMIIGPLGDFDKPA